MRRLVWPLALLASLGCSGSRVAPQAASVDAPPMPPASSAPAKVEAAAPAPTDAAPPRDAPPAPLAGEDFIDEARTLFRVAACGGDAPIPARFDAKAIATHCKDLTAKYADFKASWINVAMPYIAKLEPKGLPAEVVYPFGGSDLMSALATFPDGLVYTTISLETTGDVRKIDTITPKKLDAELALNRLHLGKLFEKIHSRTVNLDLESKSDLPGEIVFSLVALALFDMEPVSLRYFKPNPDGTLHYLTADDIAQAEQAEAAKKKSPAEIQADVFTDVELQFRRSGDASAPVKTLRHIAFNLDDKHLRADPSLLHHLEAKGKVSAMTKAASHCLWSDDFTVIRQYLLDHMAWMISDSTGIPNSVATKAGFVEDTYGVMEWPASFFIDTKTPAKYAAYAEEMKKLWKTNPQHELPFRYGYPDQNHHGHLMVTRPASGAP